MTRGLRTQGILFVFILAFFLLSCSNNVEKKFDRMLLELAGEDATIDSKDWTTLRSFIENHRAKLPDDFYDGNHISIEHVKSYIIDFFKKKRPSLSLSFYGMTGGNQYLTIKFYLERSGSTYGYDTPQCDGDFKAAIVKLLNSFPGNNKDNTDFIVNDGIYKYPKSYRDFITDPNIFNTTKGVGNPKYTDFQAIFKSLLDNTKENELSILVTDMIYSVKNMVGVNPQKVFKEEEGFANAVFLSHVKDKTALVVQFNGDYYGEYYPYNSINKGFSYKGVRPYYFLIVGNNSDIQRLVSDKLYNRFADIMNIKGYQHQYCFCSSNTFSPYYAVAFDNPENKGKFRRDRDSEDGICSIKDIKPDRNSGKIQFALAVNLKNVLADKDYLLDKNNYRIESEDGVKIINIREINQNEITQNNTETLSKASHFIIIGMDKFTHKQTIHVKLLNKMPMWIENSSCDDDTNGSSSYFSTTTFGLKYMMKGIYDAYQNAANGEMQYFDLTIGLR